MNKRSQPSDKSAGSLSFIHLVAPFLILGTAVAQAQIAVSSWVTTTVVDNADTTPAGTPAITFSNRYSTVSTFVAGGITYNAAAANTAQHAYVRRGTTGPNGSGLMVIRNGNTTNSVLGTHYSNTENLLLSGSLQTTIYDTFANTGGNGGNWNIERIDYAWNSGYTVVGDEVLTVFNVDPTGGQDDFRIAVFTGWNGTTNQPTAYASTGIAIIGQDFGSTLPLPVPTGSPSTTNWQNLAYSNGDNYSGNPSTANGNSNGHGIGGIIFKLTDLGVSVGQVIYGYSLMSTDVVVTGGAASLVDWTNTSVYLPTTTNGTEGTADFVSFGGKFIRPIPEPSTYGLFALGALASFAVWRRGRRSAS